MRLLDASLKMYQLLSELQKTFTPEYDSDPNGPDKWRCPYCWESAEVTGKRLPNPQMPGHTYWKEDPAPNPFPHSDVCILQKAINLLEKLGPVFPLEVEIVSDA